MPQRVSLCPSELSHGDVAWLESPLFCSASLWHSWPAWKCIAIDFIDCRLYCRILSTLECVVEKGSRERLKLRLSLSPSPSLALLGIQDDEQQSHHTKFLISYLLYYAKKLILMKWSALTQPAVSSWEAIVNVALPLYKMTYMNRGWPFKFD